MGELSEEEAVKAFLKEILPYYTRVSKGFLDDSSLIDLRSNKAFFKIDGTSLRSSLYSWMGLDDLAFRVCGGAVTDVIAKGGKPESIAVSVGVPKSISKLDIELLGKGVADFLGRYNLIYAGGDMNSASTKDGWIDISVLGYGSRFIPNSPWNVGEKIYLTGCLGLSSMPALIHYKGYDPRFLSREVIDKLRRPEIPINFLELVNDVYSSTDISDGLRSLYRVLKLNGVALRLINDLPLCDEVIAFMKDLRISVNEVLQYLGEEYLIAYTSSSDRGYLLGEVVSGNPGTIFFKGKPVTGGWDNFRGFIH